MMSSEHCPLVEKASWPNGSAKSVRFMYVVPVVVGGTETTVDGRKRLG